jgi:putative addiction module component (TIGR02574 family)
MEYQRVLDAVRAWPRVEQVRLAMQIREELLERMEKDTAEAVGEIPLTSEFKLELERRMAEHKANPESAITWETDPTENVYHELTVFADPNTKIWLVCDQWHYVDSGVGSLKTSVLRGRYYIELGTSGLNGVAYPIELFSDLRLTQRELEACPACARQLPVITEDD